MKERKQTLISSDTEMLAKQTVGGSSRTTYREQSFAKQNKIMICFESQDNSGGALEVNCSVKNNSLYR